MENNELYHWGVLGMKWGVRRAKSSSSSSSGRKTKSEPPSSDSKKVSDIRKKKISQMSNQELRDANNRLQLERQYKQLTKKKSKGETAVKAFIKTAGTLAAVTAAAATYRKLGNQAIDKIGDFVVKDLNKGLNML